MKKGSVKIRFSIAAMMILALPAFAAAQHGGAHASAPVAAGRSSMMAFRAGSAPARVNVRGGGPGARGGAPIAGARSSGRVIRSGNHTNSGFNGTGFNNGPTFQNVPGLGFDYPHLAAINGNRGGHGGHGGRGRGGFPFGFGGFLLDSPGYIEQGPGVDDSGVAGDESASGPADPASGDDTEVAAPRSRAPREAVQPEVAPAPPQDVEQYVLVRQDGGVVFAVAYTWQQNGMLRYITPDGVRHSIKRDALDLNATQQFNEQRGLNFEAPGATKDSA